MFNSVLILVKINMMMLWERNHLLLEVQITLPIIHFPQRITIICDITVEHVIIFIKQMVIMHIVSIIMCCLRYIRQINPMDYLTFIDIVYGLLLLLFL